MRSFTTAAVLAALALSLLPAESRAATGFSHGVAAAEVTSTSARLWTRADRAGRVFLRVTRCRRARGIERRLRAGRWRDLTVQTTVRRLIYGRMARQRNDFNVNMGDTIYMDTEVPGAWPKVPDAITVPQKWSKYRLNLSSQNLQLLRRSGPV